MPTLENYHQYVPAGFVWWKRPHMRKLNAWVLL